MNTEPTQKKTPDIEELADLYCITVAPNDKSFQRKPNATRETDYLFSLVCKGIETVVNKVLADLPPVAEQAGELSEENLLAIVSKAFDDEKTDYYHWRGYPDDAKGVLLRVGRRILSSRPSASLVVHKTADRPPTEEDGEAVFAWVSNAKPPGWWLGGAGVVTSHPTVYTAWFPVPPAPTPELGEEEKARLATLADLQQQDQEIAGFVWSRAKAFFQQENKEK